MSFVLKTLGAGVLFVLLAIGAAVADIALRNLALVLAPSAAGVVTGGLVRPLSEQSGANDARDDERDS